MSFVNYAIPWIVSKFQFLDAWDFVHEEVLADIMKNYYTTMLNIIFFLYIEYFKYYQVFTPLPKHSDYNCKEDNTTDDLLMLMLGEIVARYVYYLYWFLYHKIKSKINKYYEYQQPFELSDEFVWILCINTEFWVGLPFYPILAFAGAIFMYIHSKFLIYRLQYMKK